MKLATDIILPEFILWLNIYTINVYLVFSYLYAILMFSRLIDTYTSILIQRNIYI